jgi:hypothetical protein
VTQEVVGLICICCQWFVLRFMNNVYQNYFFI